MSDPPSNPTIRPPIKPIRTANTNPEMSTGGVILKANTTWVKFCPSVDTV